MATAATSPVAVAARIQKLPFSPRNRQDQLGGNNAKRRRTTPSQTRHVNIDSENQDPNKWEWEWDPSMVTPPESPEKPRTEGNACIILATVARTEAADHRPKSPEAAPHPSQEKSPSTPRKRPSMGGLKISPLRNTPAKPDRTNPIGNGTSKQVFGAIGANSPFVVATDAPPIEANVSTFLRKVKKSVVPQILVAAGEPVPTGNKYDLTMERAQGDVFATIKASGENEATIKLCYLDMAKGLKGLHDLGLIHGDFKEANALVMKRLFDSNYVIKVMDFDRTLALDSVIANTHYIDRDITWFSSAANVTHPDIFCVIKQSGEKTGIRIPAHTKYDNYTYAAHLFYRLTEVAVHQFQDQTKFAEKTFKTNEQRSAVRNPEFKKYHETGSHNNALTEIRSQLNTTDGFVRLTIKQGNEPFRGAGFHHYDKDLINWCLDQLDTETAADPQAMEKVIPLLETSLPSRLSTIAERNAHFEGIPRGTRVALPIANAGGGAAAEIKENSGDPITETEKQGPATLSATGTAKAGTPSDSGKGSGKSSA